MPTSTAIVITCVRTSKTSSSATTTAAGSIQRSGYRPPQEFEQAQASGGNNGPTMSFFRHAEIYRSDGGFLIDEKPTEAGFPDHRLDESPAGYSLAGWSPPEPASASPTEKHSGKSEAF